MLTLAKEGRVKAWEAGIAPVPEAESGLLRDIDRKISQSMADAMAAVADKKDVKLKRFKDSRQFEAHGPNMHPIPKFLAFRCHCALITRLYTVLSASGKSVTIQYFE
ncbi:MAG: hypothetical protein AB3N28_05405 [Kordiimonas sp.]